MGNWKPARVAPLIVAAAIVVIGCARIVSTYQVFSATFDEPDHLAAGMEWLSHNQYNYEPKHPPLERVAAALPLWLEGVRTIGDPDSWTEGRRLLASRGQFQHDLALARSGVLIFFVVACAVVFVWARSLFGPWIGVVCLFEFTMIPTVLGHSGLVTTDAVAMATLPLCVLAFLRWIETPSVRLAIVSGVCLALSIIGKFSAVPFLVACAAAWAALNCLYTRRLWLPIRVTARGATAFVVATFLTVWAGYGFRSEPLSAAKSVRAWRDRVQSDSTLHRLELRAVNIPLPAGNIVRGLGGLAAHEQAEVWQYFRGDVSTQGWPLFFSIGLAVKTPLPFLLLALAGTAIAFLLVLRRVDLSKVYPAAFPVAMLLLCVPARINLGTRHILPLFPFLAISSGLAIQSAWQAQRHRPLWRVAVVASLLWLTVESALAHPDYIAYFNQLAGKAPERILVESDLDWGQDLLRLKKEVESARIDDFHLAYYGGIKPDDCGLVHYRSLHADEPVSGWVAVSLHQLVFLPEKYAWLGQCPWRHVGKSIRLYHVPVPPPQPVGTISRDDAMARLGFR